MPSFWSKLLASCARATGTADDGSSLLSSQEIGNHAYGKYSMAIVQANHLLEDQGQVESGPFGTFVGVYDGHGGPEVSQYIKRTMFSHLSSFASTKGSMSGEVLEMAFKATEEGVEALVVEAWPRKPQIAAVGSCCLVGVIYDGTIYIANAGDSRAILGRMLRTNDVITPIQLTMEHNVSLESVRQELKALHRDDDHIVLLKRGVWRVKGIIQVSRSIGDLYLKKQEFNREPLSPQFLLSEPLVQPALTAEPSIRVHEIQPQDQFLIFASDGLWEHISNEVAVRIVNSHPQKGIARRLIKSAIEEAAKKREMRYSDLTRIERGVRRHFHDDITVIVVFLDHKRMSTGSHIAVDSHSTTHDSNLTTDTLRA